LPTPCHGGEAIQAPRHLTPYPVVKKGVGTMTFLQPGHTVCASKEFKPRK
jgi:hypothetical protein